MWSVGQLMWFERPMFVSGTEGGRCQRQSGRSVQTIVFQGAGAERTCVLRRQPACQGTSPYGELKMFVCAFLKTCFVHGQSVTVDESSSKKKSSKTFGFDSVYNGHSTQEELFDAQVKPLVEEVRVQRWACTDICSRCCMDRSCPASTVPCLRTVKQGQARRTQ